MDDILVYANTMGDHDKRLKRVLEKIKSTGLKLNREKCVFRQTQLCFLENLIDPSGVRLDPEELEAIRQLSPPDNVQELKRVLGMVKYLRNYILKLYTVRQPLHELLG